MTDSWVTLLVFIKKKFILAQIFSLFYEFSTSVIEAVVGELHSNFFQILFLN